MPRKPVKSVAVIGAGAAGAVTASALKAENCFDRIRVFERQSTAGGTWIYHPDPGTNHAIYPGKLPTETDPPSEIPTHLPATTPPQERERWSTTPIYNSLTTNVPAIAMSFSDAPFAYGPFVPHYVPKQYIEGYFSTHKTDTFLQLSTTVEDLSHVLESERGDGGEWKLTLRKYDGARHVDVWWEERFDAVVIANGHYAVPFIPEVKGLEEYIEKYPGRVIHSKFYRSPNVYAGKRVVVVGNSASGHDVSEELISSAKGPVYLSRRSKSRWEGSKPDPGIEWKPIIKEYTSGGRIIFADDTYLDNVDAVIYATGYRHTYPFWNKAANKRPLWDYETNRLMGNYWHTFLWDYPTIGLIGIARALSFRSYEYQAIALARLWSNRSAFSLPSAEEQKAWEAERLKRTQAEGKRFHDVPWDSGETFEYLDYLYRFAGLGTLKGSGRIPPIIGKDLIWALENIHKYPEKDDAEENPQEADSNGWVVVREKKKDLLAFL